MENINGLQEKLNKKAKEKMIKDINSFRQSSRDSGMLELLNSISVNIGSSDKPQNTTLSALICYDNTHINNKAEQILLPIYIKNETDYFLNKIESMQEQIDNLKNDY